MKPTEATLDEAIEYLELSDEGSIEWKIALLLRGYAAKTQASAALAEKSLRESEGRHAATEKILQHNLDEVRAQYQKVVDENIRLKADIQALKRQNAVLVPHGSVPTPPIEEERAKHVAALNKIYADRMNDPAWQSASEERKTEFARNIINIAEKITALNTDKKGGKVFDQNTLRKLTAASIPPPNLPTEVLESLQQKRLSDTESFVNGH